ncbi:hypothetical protein FF38_07977 [Lucilia cuprina]|uniref:Uncharacterized protein n=1 Tax=Lucilia cuprina TaxID=7375 RepID=A0A0L0C8T8_LUCCU|nr:uncharacterized protein LOC124419039 [Lucilia cuprina]KAI8125849.1 hypothetical protein CVS40_3989 [Lucilia cuprina]KNC27809.1 hypothetical protein FF38_07977 [Lucilia cuprina]
MSSTNAKSLKRERTASINYYSIPYTIFMYKEELRKKDHEFMRMSKVKLYLTDNLISNTIRNIGQYDITEVMNINQQMMFKKRLHTKMHKIRKLEKLGVKNIDPNYISDEL